MSIFGISPERDSIFNFAINLNWPRVERKTKNQFPERVAEKKMREHRIRSEIKIREQIGVPVSVPGLYVYIHTYANVLAKSSSVHRINRRERKEKKNEN